MSPADVKSTGAKPKNQATIDHKAANELSASICSRLRMAIRYADLALEHDDIFDNFGFDRSVEQFIGHARDISERLKKLRKARGVTD